MPAPVGGAPYCQVSDVEERLYSASGVLGATPDDPGRDAWLGDLILARSRDFDRAIFGPELQGAFAPLVEQRLFSGLGNQKLEVTPFAQIIRIEMDATPGQQSPTWQDYTPEITQRRIGFLPIRSWPKKYIFRQASFYVDPWRLGNIRLTGLWGVVLPDAAATQPDESWEDTYCDPLAVASDLSIASLTPTGGGWWVTPTDVKDAIASWAAASFQAAKMSGGKTSGSGASKITNDASIPGDVLRVINIYKGEHNVPKFALVADDGSDLDDGAPVWRWAGWQTIS
jgi:hypothetical protein